MLSLLGFESTMHKEGYPPSTRKKEGLGSRNLKIENT
jgi:hypothetical protein